MSSVDTSDIAASHGAESGACVGPVLQRGHVTDAVVAAIVELNAHVRLLDRGAYVRVLVPHCCRVTCNTIERHLGRKFELPVDLEKIMTSFQGNIFISPEQALWSVEVGATSAQCQPLKDGD